MTIQSYKQSLYILIWGLSGFVLTLIGWKLLIIPIEAVEGLLPDIPIQELWREAGWGISAWSFLVAVFVLMAFILEPWGSKGLLFEGRWWTIIPISIILSATFGMPAYWTFGLQGIVIATLHIAWGWTSILSALGIIVGIAGIHKTKPLGIANTANKYWNRLISIKPLWLILIVSLWILLITGLVAWRVFGAVPHVGDSVCQIFNAKIFLHGQLWAQPPPVELRPFFFETFLNDTGKWFSQYLPGFPLLMVPMVLLGTAWLLNPLLTALTVPVAYGIGKSVGGEHIGKYAIIALALSPFVIFMAGGQMNHPAMLFWVSLTILAFLRLHSTRWRWWAFLAGLALGMGLITRPLTGLVIALPIFLFWINQIRTLRTDAEHDRDIWLRQLWLIILGAAGPLIFLLIYNLATTGNVFKLGYSVVWQGHATLGFGDSSWGPPHTPALGLLNTLNNLNGLNRYLFEIPIPALTGILLFLIFRGSGRNSPNPNHIQSNTSRHFELLFAVIFTVVGAYFFYFYQDYCYGPRFMYELIVPVIIIIVAGIVTFITALESLGYSRESSRTGVIFFGFLCIITALSLSIPRQIAIYQDVYWDISRKVLDEVKRRHINNAIVFIEDFPSTNRHAKLHALGLGMRDAWYWTRQINDNNLDDALRELGLDPEMTWTPIDNNEVLWLILNKHRGDPPSPMEDAVEGKRFTPYDSGLIAMDPHWDSNPVIYARHLGKYNQVLIDRFPERSAWLYSWDTFVGAFTLKLLQSK